MNITCPHCAKNFKQKKNLYAHIRNTHDVNPSVSGSLLCPADKCSVRSLRYEGLRKHLATVHRIVCEREEFQFKSLEEFIAWKQEIDLREKTAYVLSTGSVTLANKNKKTYYSCHRSHRSGTKQRRKQNTVRKSPSSKKMSKTCPSTIEVSVNRTCVQVIKWKTHWGHSDDISNVEQKLYKLFYPIADSETSYDQAIGLDHISEALHVTDQIYRVNELQGPIPSRDNIIIQSGSFDQDIGCKSVIEEDSDKITNINAKDCLKEHAYFSVEFDVDNNIEILHKLNLLKFHASTLKFNLKESCQFNSLLDQCLDICK